MKVYGIVLLYGFLLLFSCKEEAKIPIVKETKFIETVLSPANDNSSLPFLYTNENKTLLSWVEKEGDSLNILKYAELVEGEWQQSKSIFQGTDWFVNWADFPAIAEQNGNLISHVLKKSSGGTYSYDVKLNLLPEGETKWKTDLPLHTDGTPTEHGFVSTLTYNDGFFITWLDGRNTEEDKNGNRGAMTLRAAEVSTTGEIRNEVELDARICDCCQTTAAITENGPVVMYRDRSENEVRDMSIVRWENGNWTAPKTVYEDNWKINGCPVNGPKSAVLLNTLAMTWFTAANEEPKVQIIFSSDGGANFDSPVLVAQKNVIGRVDVVLLDDKTAIVSWMEANEGKAKFMAAKIHRDGTKGKENVITAMNASRQSGFPQMERVGDQILFAWTAISNTQSEVKTALVSLEKF
ncbi:MAG: hypothetical protein AB8B59_15425 [Maribacter sp.]